MKSVMKCLFIIMFLFILSAGMATGQSETISPWMMMESGTSGFFKSVWGDSSSQVFVAGGEYDYETMQYQGVILAFDGAEWKAAYRGASQDFNSLWGTSGSDIFVVGRTYDDEISRGIVLHYDGSDWILMSEGLSAPLSDVWGTSGSDVFAVGDAGTILHFDGTAWHETESATDRDLRSVWGASASDIFAVGNAGAVLHFDGTGWSEMTSVTERNLSDVRGLSGSDVYAVGDAGVILHFDGTEWREMSSGTDACLRSVWRSETQNTGHKTRNLFVAGDAGTILRSDGTEWHKTESGTGNRLRSVMGLPGVEPADVFAVGDFGTILRYLPLTLELPESVAEGDGSLTGEGIVRSVYAADSDLAVSLISEDDSEMSVPGTVVIPAGQTSVLFNLAVTDDTLLDGSPEIKVTASAPGHSPAVTFVQVTDSETTTLSLTLPETAAEGDDALRGTVFVSDVVEKDVAVSLTSDDTGEVTVPESVTIPSGQTSAVFDLMIADDTEIDGIQTAAITASVAGWTSGSNTIAVNDNELRELSVSSDIPDPVSEENGVLSDAGTVSVPGTVVSDLVVRLSSDHSLKISVPETVTIPSGESSVRFDLTVIEDSETDGNQTVTITASAEEWTAGTTAIEVSDNDPGTLKFGSETYEVPESGGSATITVIRDLSTTGRVTADYITEDYTATTEEDYTAVSGTLVFEAGETSKTFSVPILNDSAAEGDETVRLILVNSSEGAKLGRHAVLTISDDEMTCLTTEAGDGEVLLNWCDPSQSEGFVGYDIYREGIKVNSGPVTEMSYTVTESEHGRYCYAVETLYENKAGKMSNQACALLASDYALSYDGVSGYAGISEVSGLDFSADQSFTVELWVKPDEERTDPAIISNKGWNSGYNKGFIFAHKNKVWKVNIGDGQKRADINNIGDIYDGEWHHLAMVTDRENKIMKVFQDGSKKGESDIYDIRDMNTDMALNLGQDGTGAYGKWFKGAIDEVRIWRVARTDDEIRSSVFTRLTGSEPGLILYWQMEKITSGVLTDRSGNGNHGTIQKGCEWVAGVPYEDMLLNRSLKAEVGQEGNVSLTWEPPDDLTGYNVYRNGSKINADVLPVPGYTDSDVVTGNSYCYGIAPVCSETGEGNISDEICIDIAAEYALRLDGTDDYVRLPGADILGLRYNDFTVEAWVNVSKFENTGHYQPILIASPRLFLGIRDRRPYMNFEFDNSEEANDLEGDAVIHENQWYHIAWRYTRTEGPIGEQAIFVNGILVASEDGHYAFHGLGTTEIGRIGTICFPGMMDEIRIWNTARTEAEIASAMYTKLAGTEAGLTAYLPADEWYPVLTDRSGNENHGSMMMGATYSKEESYDYLSKIPQFPNVVGSDSQILLTWISPGRPADLLGYNILRDGEKINTEILTDTTYTDRAISSGSTHCYTVEAAYGDSDETCLSNERCMLTAPDYALSFDGINNYAGIPNFSGTDFSADQSFTAELWVKTDTDVYSQPFLSNKDFSLGRNKGFAFVQFYRTWKVNIGDGTNYTYRSMPMFSDGEWHHLAMVIDRETQQIRTFQDGNKEDEKDISEIGDMNSGLSLNIAEDGTGDCSRFKGMIDEVRLWSVARTDEEIISSMFTRLAGDEPGLAVCWAMNEWNIATMTDISDNGNHGKIYGATPVRGVPTDTLVRKTQNLAASPDPDAGLIRLIWNAPNLNENLSGYHILRNGKLLDTGILTETAYTDTDLLSEKTYCYAVRAVYDDTTESSLSDEACTVITDNYALNFDKNDYVLIPNEAHFDFKNAVTLEAWIQVSQFDKRWQVIVGKGNDTWELPRYSSSDTIAFFADNTKEMEVYGNINVNDGNWHHVAGVYDGNNLHLYIDGQLDNSISAEPIDSITNTDNPVMIGANSQKGGRSFNGKICEVRVWSVARTQEEIQETLHKRLRGNENGLAGYWPMDEPGETVTDHSGNGNHGIISGAEWLRDVPIAE